MKILSKCAFVVLLFLQVTALAQFDPHTRLPVDSAVRIGKLSNGLTYYIRHNSRPEKKAELRLVVNAGSILEDSDQLGLAHFTEHMAFNGSKNFKKNDIISFLQSIGVEFGADLNAYTGFDETVYILPIPTEKKENIEKAFQILQDWATAISFDADEIEKERGIVLEEERLGKGADERIFRQTFPEILQGSVYAQRLPIGKAEVIKTFKPEVIKRFYKDWYRPELMAVIVVGDIDPDVAQKLVISNFENLSNPRKPKSRTNPTVPARTVSKGMVVTDKEATNHVVEIYYPFVKEDSMATLGDYRKMMVKMLFRIMLNQRLQELTQKAQPPFIYGASTLSGGVRGYEAFQSIAYVSQAGPASAIRALVQENERASRFGFTSSELDRTKKMMMKSMERGFNERHKTESSSFASEYIQHFLQGEAIPGIQREYNYYREFLDDITLEEVNAAAKQSVPAEGTPRLVLLTGPDTADFQMPKNEALLQMVADAEQSELTAYEDKEIASSLMTAVPQSGQIVSSKKDELLGTEELKLSNGVRVLLKPTDFKNDQIVMVGSRWGGQYLYDIADRFNAEFASTIVSQMGVGNFSPLDLRKVLAGKTASVSVRIGAVSESVNAQSGTSDAETMLQLTHLYFTSPRMDQELFESFVNKQKSFYQNMAHDPEYIFQDSLLHILYGDHPWAPKLPEVATFEKINLNKSFEIYRQRFGNAHGFNFVITGSFEPDSMKNLVEQYLGSLPSKATEHSYRDVGLRPASGVIKKQISKGQEPKSLIRMIWNGETDFNSADRFKLQALSEVINIKITETLREDLSGAYGGGMSASMNKVPYQNYSVSVSIPCGPENVQKLITATLQEINRVKTMGPSQTDLNKVKETWKQQYRVNIRENSYWARQLLQAYELATDPHEILLVEKTIDRMTSKDVQMAAQTFLDMKNYVEVVLNPE